MTRLFGEVMTKVTAAACARRLEFAGDLTLCVAARTRHRWPACARIALEIPGWRRRAGGPAGGRGGAGAPAVSREGERAWDAVAVLQLAEPGETRPLS